MKQLLLSFAGIFLVVLANAQKLPNIQEKSLRAPANIKVDGKPTELNNQFQAYNKSTEIFYTISNDNDKLYLTVQATDLDVINKIMCGGITLTINGTGKTKDEQGKKIIFPVLNRKDFPETGAAINVDRPENWAADSFMVALNEELGFKARDIEVRGIKEIPSSVISIYNPEGIKAVALVDNRTILTYELSVPLKYFGLSVKDSKPFIYNIKLRGMNYDGTHPSFLEGFRHLRLKVYYELRRTVLPVLKDDNRYVTGPGVPLIIQLISPTDFSGEYMLAK